MQICESSITWIIFNLRLSIIYFFISRCDQQIWYGKQLMIYRYVWACLRHKLDTRGAVALKVCSLSQIFLPVTIIAGIGYNTLHAQIFLLRFAILIFRFPLLTVHILRYLGLKCCPPDIRWSSIELQGHASFIHHINWWLFVDCGYMIYSIFPTIHCVCW